MLRSTEYERALLGIRKPIYVKAARKVTSGSKGDLNNSSNKHTNFCYSDFRYKE